MNETFLQDQVYTVGQITRHIKSTLENDPELTSIWVKGEVYNLTYHSSGHIYFSLKDKDAVLSVTFFKYANNKMKFRLENGMSVMVFGSISLFEKGGRYQINISTVRLEGVGELQKQIEQLKAQLTKEGVFDPIRKKELPFLPKRIGVVTSPTGAAIRDIMKVALRRYPNIEIVLAPAKVQGDDAAITIARGIEELNRDVWNIDVIIAGRGGGSFEDLMPFNEEIVVRAFSNSKVPIISAVGHQIDHPLSDDAADVYAPTPSAAAEIAVPKRDELKNEIDYLLDRSENALLSEIRHYKLRMDSVHSRRVFQEPQGITSTREQLVLELDSEMSAALSDKISLARQNLLSIPDIVMLMSALLKEKKHAFLLGLQAMEQLSPVAVLQRGYAIARDSNEKVIRTVDSVRKGEPLSVSLHDGVIHCETLNVKKGFEHGKEKSK